MFLDKGEALLPLSFPDCFLCGHDARSFCSHLVAMRSKLGEEQGGFLREP